MSIELWGGLECTVNRIRDKYSDQIKRTGHEFRIDDLDRFAELGIRTLRYPVLWERTSPEGQPDWRWPDERLNHLRRLRIQPIVGLLHHGSGPRFTSLLDPEFPLKFCAYARLVAERYPWIENYTPINEPLTTARFSCLYGHWYPHKADSNSFARALLLQCRAIVMAIQAIRSVNSDARLIQTEDLGKTFSTSKLGYQARFENSRRWITWDLLNGRVDSEHALWQYFRSANISEAELLWFRENPCPPAVLGINHYVTSDRYLDEKLNQYPAATWGGNGRDRYADVEAVRVVQSNELGLEARIAEAWLRYKTPIAITEAHLGCVDHIQQVRWFYDAWQAARSQRKKDVDLIAVTSWSLLGAFDWDSLLTEHNDHYERGAFELKNGKPEPTELAHRLRELANGENVSAENLILQAGGWWKQADRIRYPAAEREIDLRLEPAV